MLARVFFYMNVIYKFTILSEITYCNSQPFYVGQYTNHNITKQNFVERHKCSYDGSGKMWLRFLRGLKRKHPEDWLMYVKREVLFYSDNCSQRTLDAMEEYWIKKKNAHYLKKLGGCNILHGTANKFGSGSLMKDKNIAKRVTIQLIGRKGAKRSEEGRRNLSIAAKKSWINADDRRKSVSNAVKRRMSNPSVRKNLSDKLRGRKRSEESIQKIRDNHYDCSKEKHPLWGSTFIWITNGVENKRHDSNKPIPDGFYKGMKQKNKIYKH